MDSTINITWSYCSSIKMIFFGECFSFFYLWHGGTWTLRTINTKVPKFITMIALLYDREVLIWRELHGHSLALVSLAIGGH